MQDYEKLGAFYLGREFDQDKREKTDLDILYDSRDLTTHAVVVGMTGSGKTGLCIGLLEEAGIDHIPAIVIDPKGDIANLLLTFPNLSPEEFRPWIDEGQAARAGKTPEEFATSEAEKWKTGLNNWGQSGERIQKFRDSVDMRVYTPGSSSGRPLTILKSFAAPCEAVLQDHEALLDRICSATSGLLALLGIDADPIRSREHILISKLLDNAWKQNRDLDLGQLIGEIQSPPFETVGIMAVDAFFPKKDRQSLAMTMNNLLASPTFASWLVGEPLDIKSMLHTPEGKPCISIVSISHLNEKERMFFVTILLNEVISWMRTQAGTSSLRAILYMDEIYGYFPPTANPPSKIPMLTLLKQARAFGLGCVLATQNPVDLDYKGLSNTGTWFLGRLQTERDKARVLEGLEGASNQAGAKFDRRAMERTLAGLGSRVFLMNNVHDDQPVVFETRWAMSYLRGPLTRNQLQLLVQQDPTYDPTAGVATAEQNPPIAEPSDPIASLQPDRLATVTAEAIDPRTLLPEDIKQYFESPPRSYSTSEPMEYYPTLMGSASWHYKIYGLDQWDKGAFLAQVCNIEKPDHLWESSQRLAKPLEFVDEPPDGSKFVPPSAILKSRTNYRRWERDLKAHVFDTQKLPLLRCLELNEYSSPGMTQGDFRVELEQKISERRDLESEKLRSKFIKRFSDLRVEIRKAENALDKESEEFRSSRLSSILSVGSSIMGALLSRKTFSSTNSRRASSSARSVGKSAQKKSNYNQAKAKLDELQIEYEALDREFATAMAEVADKQAVEKLTFEQLYANPQKSDMRIDDISVVWRHRLSNR